MIECRISKLELINESLLDIYRQITYLQQEIKRHEKYREEDWKQRRLKA